jgi:hypothetical protein
MKIQGYVISAFFIHINTIKTLLFCFTIYISNCSLFYKIYRASFAAIEL